MPAEKIILEARRKTDENAVSQQSFSGSHPLGVFQVVCVLLKVPINHVLLVSSHHAKSPSRFTLADRKEWMMKTKVLGQQCRSSCLIGQKNKWKSVKKQ